MLRPIPYVNLNLVSFVVTLCGAVSLARSQPTVTLPDSIYERIQKAVTCRRVSGLAVSVVFNGQEVMSTGFGMADVKRNRTVDNSTRFLLGSVSKTFTAALLGMLMKDSRFRNGWDSLVADVMGPDFKLIDSLEKEATVRDVLSHRMGLASYRLPLMLGLYDKYSNREYCSRFRYINVTSFNSFRNQFEYNNQMFVLAGCMAEIVGNGSFETLLRDRIFHPLGMNDTQLLTTHNLRQMKDLALMYYTNETDKTIHHLSSETLRCIVTLGPAGGIVSTASDMKKWMLFLLNRGKNHHGRQLIPIDVMERMFSPQTAMPRGRTLVNNDYFPVIDSTDSYGLGFILGYYRGHPKIMHTGRLLAFETRMTILQGAKLGIFSSTNGPAFHTSEIHQVLHYMIADSLLNLTDWLNDSTACTFPKPWSSKMPGSKSRKRPGDDMKILGINEKGSFQQWLKVHCDLYIGIYGHPLLGNFSVSYNDSDGNLHFSFGLHGTGLLAYGNDTLWTMELSGRMAFLQVTLGSMQVEFSEPDRNGRFQSLIAVAFEPSQPPIFRRNVKWVEMSKSPFSVLSVTGKQRLLIIVACLGNLMIILL